MTATNATYTGLLSLGLLPLILACAAQGSTGATGPQDPQCLSRRTSAEHDQAPLRWFDVEYDEESSRTAVLLDKELPAPPPPHFAFRQATTMTGDTVTVTTKSMFVPLPALADDVTMTLVRGDKPACTFKARKRIAYSSVRIISPYWRAADLETNPPARWYEAILVDEACPGAELALDGSQPGARVIRPSTNIVVSGKDDESIVSELPPDEREVLRGHPERTILGYGADGLSTRVFRTHDPDHPYLSGGVRVRCNDGLVAMFERAHFDSESLFVKFQDGREFARIGMFGSKARLVRTY